MAILLVATVLVANVLLFYSHNLDMHWLFNSDLAFIPSLYKDIFVNGGEYAKWHLPAAPYLFPDTLLFSLILLLTNNAYHTSMVFFTVETLLIISAILLILRRFYSFDVSIKLTALSFSLVFIFSTLVTPLFYVSVFHLGELIVGLFLIYFVIRILETEKTPVIPFIWILAMSTLTLMSDSLYLLHFILPLMASLFIYGLVGYVNVKKLYALVSILILSIVFAYLLYKLLIINPNKPRIVLEIGNFGFKFQQYFELLKSSFEKHTLNSILTLLVYSLCIYIVVVRKSIKNKPVYFIALYLIFMFLANISAGLLLANNIADRYMIPVFILPLFFAPIILKDFIKIKYINNYLLIAVIPILIGIHILNIYNQIHKSEFKNEFYPADVKCFDKFISETNSKFGASGYWLSKKLFILSKHQDITIAQYLSNFSKFHWVSTDNWYKPTYDFILIHHTAPDIHKLNKQKIISKVGKPSKIYQCPKIDILYFKKGVSI